jgi:predicted DNA-binding WGR domain protein
MRRFELNEGKSSKFWEVSQVTSELHIRWGRIGTTGQSQTKSFADEAKAAAALDKLIREKVAKGYQEVGSVNGSDGATADAAASPAEATVAQASAEPAKTPAPDVRADSTSFAAEDELPAVLSAPPWSAKPQKAKVSTVGVPGLEPLPLAPTEETPPNRDKAMSLSGKMAYIATQFGFDKSGELTDRAAAALNQRDPERFVEAWRQIKRTAWFTWSPWQLTAFPAEFAVPVWNAIADETAFGCGELMATFGAAALPGFRNLVSKKPLETLELALGFGDVELAVLVARAFAKLKKAHDLARQWLLKYPEHTACALIAPALGKAGADRDAALAALRLLKDNGHEALLMEVAGRYQRPEVVDALRAALGVVKEAPAAKPTKLPAWWKPTEWRRPTLRNGKALPDSAVEYLGQMLTIRTDDGVYPGIAEVREACSPESLARFAWDCFSAWMEAGAPAKDNWALTALGHFGDDEVARQLTPMIRAWPGESGHARAVVGLDVLASIGSDVALMHLNGIAQKVKFKALQDRAREKIDAVAAARGLSLEELEDRLAPDLGLDATGTMVLSFGPRSFKVGFDEALKPYVCELAADGTVGDRLADLPKPKKTDDAAAATQATERFKLLKQDARTVARQQLLRLEVAMCAQRRWTPESFRTFLVEHPLVRHVVQRLVWGVYSVADGGSFGGTLRACFRVAEDGSYATATDEPFSLPAEADIRVGIPHALELDPADAGAFGQVFADYELLQPFPQLGRDTHALTDAERAERRLVRWKGVQLPTTRVLGLLDRGWRRGPVEDAGTVDHLVKPIGRGRSIELYLRPGIWIGMIGESPDQTVDDVVWGETDSRGDVSEPAFFAELDAIIASELIRDLEALRQ